MKINESGNNVKSVSILVSGVVQGVGFRPFTAALAQRLHVKGTVLNAGGAVEIVAEGDREAVDLFIQKIRNNPPLNSRIDQFQVDPVPYYGYEDFTILKSVDKDRGHIPYIPPDVSVCDRCIGELYDQKNRRYRHPFISCASCGPRYSIIDRIPYDRCNTVMQEFDMCPDCDQEYTNQTDHRFHAQTISCHDCGPQLKYRPANGSAAKEKGIKADLTGNTVLPDFTGDAALAEAIRVIQKGGIIAVKGIGGYHLACSPFNEKTVQNMRSVKKREEKPFAVMFPDLKSIQEFCYVNEQEKNLLFSPAKPIVLLLRKRNDRMSQEVFKDSRFLGAFLPYTPLHCLLLDECGPLIMTSANLSDSPIIIEDEEIFNLASPLVEGVLYHSRKIRLGLDDSVTQATDGNIRILRYSRGYAPLPVRLNCRKTVPLLAAGGDLKASFCILKDQNAYVSQYFGDLENERIYESYTKGVQHLENLLEIFPEAVICDLHPAYFSRAFAVETGLPVFGVQHHFAHIASVMAENQLSEPVIGVAFDGIGYGTDDAVWGGEFLLCTPGGFERAGHLEYTPLCGADAASRDSWRSAVSFLHAAGLDSFGKAHGWQDSGREDNRFAMVQTAIDHHINTVQSSSMGRLFDAVSSILSYSDVNHYEGQSAIILENAAYRAQSQNMLPAFVPFEITESSGILKAAQIPVIQGIVDGLGKGISKERLALGFHEAVADLVLQMCCKLRSREKINKVALSGGVFQNVILFERCLELLRKNNFMVYYNRQVPSNDGGIALGQALIGSDLLK